MPSKIVKALKRVRGQRKTPERLSTRDRKIAEYYGRQRIDNFWQRDVSSVRMQNLDKAKVGLADYRKAQQVEKERQAEINRVRLKNLAKARKAKQRRNK